MAKVKKQETKESKKSKTKEAPMEQPGIYELRFLAPSDLAKCANELNWRKHPQRQRQAFQALKSQVGYADAVIYNEVTKKLVDGHMRLDEAIRNKEASIPVLVGRWTPEQETLLLEKKDILTSMAETNTAALDNLVAMNQKTIDQIKSKSGTKEILTKLNSDVSNYTKSIADGSAPRVLLERKKREWKDRVEEEAQEEETYNGISEVVFKDDVIFPSTLPWDIPPLRGDLLCQTPPTHTWNRDSDQTHLSTSWYCYGAGPNTFPSPDTRQGGFLGFYTEDFRFDRAWSDSPNFVKELLTQDWSGVLLPDYSQYGDWPKAINLHNLYRSRWCGRYWQEAGIRVLPLVQCMGDIDAYHELTLATLPPETPIVAMQCRTGGESPDYWTNLGYIAKTTLDYLEDLEFFVIYGGADNRKYLEGHLPSRKGLRYVFLESFLARRRKATS